MHFGCTQPPGRAGRVNRHIAATDDHDALARQIRRIAIGNVAQELHTGVDAFLVVARNTQATALVRSQCQDDSRVSLRLQAADG